MAELREILPRIHAAALQGRVPGLDALAAQQRAMGEDDMAWAVRLMAAALRMDMAQLDPLIRAAPRPAFAQDPGLHYLLVWTLAWTQGFAAALAEAAGLAPRAAALPEAWRHNLDYLIAGGTLAAPRPSPLTPGEGSFRYRLASGLPVVDLTIDDHPGLFIIDTAAPTTVVTPGFADRAAMRRAGSHRTVFDGSGQGIRLLPAVARRLVAGGLTLENAPVDILPLSAALGVDGLLSPLRSCAVAQVVFDGAKHEVRVSGSRTSIPEDCVYRAELLWSEGRPFVVAGLESGDTIMLLLDTGAGANLLAVEVARALTGVAAVAPHLRSRTAVSQTDIYQGPTLAVAIGNAPPERMHFLAKRVPETPEALFPNLTQGYLGAPWFERRKVCIAADRTAIHFSDPAPSPSSSAAPSEG